MKKNDVEKIARVVIEIEESESETRFPFRFRKNEMNFLFLPHIIVMHKQDKLVTSKLNP